MSSKLYVGDIGTEIIVDCGEDISSSTSVSLIVKKPDGTIVTWDGAVYELNFIRYIVQAGDFSLNGKYFLQPKVVLPTWEGLGETSSFIVNPAFS